MHLAHARCQSPDRHVAATPAANRHPNHLVTIAAIILLSALRPTRHIKLVFVR